MSKYTTYLRSCPECGLMFSTKDDAQKICLKCGQEYERRVR